MARTQRNAYNIGISRGSQSSESSGPSDEEGNCSNYSGGKSFLAR